MKTKINPVIVGSFVIGAFALGFMAVLAFGGRSLFSKPERFIIFFDESIQGLDVGSPVKLRGVHVGRVVDLSIRYDRATDRSQAAVVCELDQKSVTDANGVPIDISAGGGLEDLIDHGLRAQLGIAGLATGLMFVELDFVNPTAFPAGMRATDSRYVVVPSMPSAISEFQASATALMNRIQQIDFQGLSTELKGLLQETHARIAGVDFRGLVDQWQRTGASVDLLARSPALPHALANLDVTLDALRASLDHLNTQVDVNGKSLQATLEQAHSALAEIQAASQTTRRFVDAQQNLGTDADRAFARLADAADSVQRLADFLERNPNAIITGRKPKP